MAFHPPSGGGAAASITIGTTTATSGTIGSVLFVGAGPVVQQDNPNFFWDDTNNRLGIGTASPTSPLHLAAGDAADGTIPSILVLRTAVAAATDVIAQFGVSDVAIASGGKICGR